MPGVPDPSVLGDWAEQAACRGYPVSWWFPSYEHYAGKSAREARSDAGVAMRICTELCQVRAECLAHALLHREFGLWGATTDRQRQEMRGRSRRRRVA